MQICQDSIRDRAISRFRTQNIDFQSIHVDDNPGRQDWVSGELAIPRRFGRPDIYRFSCSVDFRTGQVRSAQIDHPLVVEKVNEIRRVAHEAGVAVAAYLANPAMLKVYGEGFTAVACSVDVDVLGRAYRQLLDALR